MKSFTSYINESKEKPLYTEYDIKMYFNLCVQRWLENVSRYNILTIDEYSKIGLCRDCEIMLNLLEKFSSDINLHFYNAESDADKKKYGSYWTEENQLFKVFTIIEQLINIDFNEPNIKTAVDTKAEIKELKSHFDELVKKCNDKWHKYIDSQKKSCGEIGMAVPCSCCGEETCCGY